jgi:hypothetical protein
MAWTAKLAPPVGGWTKECREIFLAKLADTSNVTASAKAAGHPARRFYDERRKSKPFAAAWHIALCDGYARLESELLAEALRPASGQINDATLKSRAMKIRLGTTLLSLHRTTVRGGRGEAVLKPAQTPGEARARLESRFAEMRTHLADHDG